MMALRPNACYGTKMRYHICSLRKVEDKENLRRTFVYLLSLSVIASVPKYFYRRIDSNGAIGL